MTLQALQAIIPNNSRFAMARIRALTYTQQVEIADLLLKGVTKQDISTRFAIDPKTLFNLLKTLEFKQLLSDREAVLRAAAIRELSIDKDRERGIQELEQYRNRRRQAAIASQVFGISALQRLKQQFDSMDLRQLSPKDVAALVRAFSSLVQDGSNSEAEYLGLDKLVAYFKSEQSNDDD